MDEKARIMTLVIQLGNGCWHWHGTQRPPIHISVGKKTWHLPRYIKSVLDGRDFGRLTWACPNHDKACVNPNHWRGPRTRKNKKGPDLILTPSQIADIEKLSAMAVSKEALATKYGVSVQTIRRALDKKDAYRNT